MSGAQQRLAWLMLHGVPRHLRGSVWGDLLESGASLREALEVVWQFQLEPYRDRASRRSLLGLLLAAAGLLWIVPLAAQGLLAQSGVFDDGFSRAALQLWSAPALMAALVSGLLIGRASVLPPHADAPRAHLALLLAPGAAWAATSALQAVLAAGVLLAAAWVGHLNRVAEAPEPV